MSALPSARVDQATFLGLLWSGTAVSLCFLVFRVFVRIKSFKALYSDDFTVIAAWFMLLGTAALWQVEANTLYEQYAVESGHEPFTLGFVDRDTAFLRTIVPFNILFYSCLWTVKLSFLLFFRRLGSKVQGFRIWWWCVLVITGLTWIACVADIHYACSLSSYDYIISYCPSLAAIHFENRTFYANCAADVVTDCLIISIPVMMLWNVRIRLQQRLILFSIFSITVVVMIVSIVRVAVVNSDNENADISWLYLWSNIEMATSIIIACVASFRQLFITSKSQNQYGGSGLSTARRGLLGYFRSHNKSSKNSGSSSKWTSFRSRHTDTLDKSDSQTQIVPLHNIHVTHNVNISNTASTDYNINPQHFNFEHVKTKADGLVHDGQIV